MPHPRWDVDNTLLDLPIIFSPYSIDMNDRDSAGHSFMYYASTWSLLENLTRKLFQTAPEIYQKKKTKFSGVFRIEDLYTIMVSYYGPSGMYRHQQQISATNGHFQPNSPMHSWYAGYHQSPQIGTAAPPSGYCVQEEQQVWHHHPAHPHSVFQHDFQDFVHTGIPPLQHPQHQIEGENQLPSPPITVSGSDMSSPGGQSGNISPQQNSTQNSRPPPARSPYEWIKKTSYQSQPNPVGANPIFIVAI
ncbi:hypothetical protein NQ317_005923 [Molorchus minor]|uniref:Uncharacterized protein n=1 Tax=Molorchus minor TaxID=1323400 RepID=A0ABQ9JER2_9CUCU|nr:hypothetical protein NQ317_005923 [Molorchus minor]